MHQVLAAVQAAVLEVDHGGKHPGLGRIARRRVQGRRRRVGVGGGVALGISAQELPDGLHEVVFRLGRFECRRCRRQADRPHLGSFLRTPCRQAGHEGPAMLWRWERVSHQLSSQESPECQRCGGRVPAARRQVFARSTCPARRLCRAVGEDVVDWRVVVFRSLGRGAAGGAPAESGPHGNGVGVGGGGSARPPSPLAPVGFCAGAPIRQVWPWATPPVWCVAGATRVCRAC